MSAILFDESMNNAETMYLDTLRKKISVFEMLNSDKLELVAFKNAAISLSR